MANAAIIIRLFVGSFGGLTHAHPIIAITIVIYMVTSSRQIATTPTEDLMNREFPGVDRIKIREIALQHPKVRDVHDMRAQSSGPYSFI